MRTYTKRIGFLINSEHIKATGGNGQFAKSFCRLMDQHDIKVDIITDREPHYTEYANSINTNIIYQKTTPQGYSLHQTTFGKPDSICLERMVNFRKSVMLAMETNMYDVLLCNSPESILATTLMGMEDNIQIIAYTHLESQIFSDTKNPFSDVANEVMRQTLTTDKLYIATQSEFNKSQFTRPNVFVCPIPLTEPDLLKRHNKKREGVLFVGRWESGKNPELFLKLIEETKLPARIITSENGVKKFQERLDNINADYEIKANIIGQEKVDFMTSCRVAFNPSLVESYGMAFHEQMIQMPTFCLEGQRWTNNFNEDYFYTCDKKNMVELVSEFYKVFQTSQEWYENGIIDAFVKQENNVFLKWKECFDSFSPKTVTSETAAIAKMDSLCYRELIDELGRKDLSLGNDLKAMYNNKPKFKSIYTDSDTYLTKDEKKFKIFTPTVKQKPIVEPKSTKTKEKTVEPTKSKSLFVFEGE